MKLTKILRERSRDLRNSSVAIAVALFLVISFSTVSWTPSVLAVLAQGDAVTDPTAILRNALPIDNVPIRKVQESIEDIAKNLRAKRWSPIKKDVKDANYALTTKGEAILASIPSDRQAQGTALLEQLKTGVTALDTAVEAKDKEAVLHQRQEILNQITALEELMVVGFPFAVPPEYANLPQLKGRATVEMETTKGNLTIVVDGYNAPVNAGNFVDLVQRGFYNGLPFIRSEDNFVVQSGDPSGAEVGFIDPKTKAYRSIPLEIFVRGEEEATYGNTLEELGIYLPNLVLPFNAFGAVALARPDTDPNGGSSQFFFFKFDNELTPPGFNLMDGRYSVFGYLVQGKEVLEELSDKDKILSAKVVYGLNNLVQPSS
jgi:peptidylprolyl isomerase